MLSRKKVIFYVNIQLRLIHISNILTLPYAGGIRTVSAAIDWLNAGAAKVVIGTAASAEFLSQVSLGGKR